MGGRPEVTVIIQFPNNQASSRMNSNQSHKTPYAIKALRKQKKISPFLSTKNIIPNVPKHESQKDQTAPSSI